MTLFGAVLLSSFILVVIVPEGFEILIEAYPEGESEEDEPAIEAGVAGGISMIIGFLIIFMIDLFVGLHGDHESSSSDLSTNSNSNNAASKSQKGSNLLSVGFIFHALCDGVALGAAVYSDNSDVVIGIFIGVFAHKLVVGLALTINLLGKSNKKSILICLFIFSIAAPVGAYIVLGILVGIDASEESVIPGILILLSAGTLIYVGMAHSLPEAIQARKGGHGHGHGNAGGHGHSHGHGNRKHSAVDTEITNAGGGADNHAMTESVENRQAFEHSVTGQNANISIPHEHMEENAVDWIDFVLIIVAVLIPILLVTLAGE